MELICSYLYVIVKGIDTYIHVSILGLFVGHVCDHTTVHYIHQQNDTYTRAKDPDETLRRRTLDLLYSMTNPANVTVVIDKLLGFLRTTQDDYLRTELVSRINQLAEKYAPDVGEFEGCSYLRVIELNSSIYVSVKEENTRNICSPMSTDAHLPAHGFPSMHIHTYTHRDTRYTHVNTDMY